MTMLVTLAAMKTNLGINDGSQDDFLTEQIHIVSDAIEAYTVRRLLGGDFVETFYQDEWREFNTLPNRKMVLKAYPVTALTTVKSFASVEDVTGTSINGVRTHFPSGIIRRDDASAWFDSCDHRIEVTYTGGYAVENMPYLIRSVVYAVVGERYNRKIAGVSLNFGSDVQRISIPGSISIDFDYSLQNNDPKTPMCNILGNYLNMLGPFKSERATVHSSRLQYVVEEI